MKNLSPEEAIAILNDMKIDIPVPKAAVTQRKRNVALDMAISAMSCSEIPNSSDMISRKAVIEALYSQREKSGNIWVRTAITNCVEAMRQLPPAEPAPDQNGDLWITVPDIDKVTRIYVQESKSKFCRIFYEERI